MAGRPIPTASGARFERRVKETAGPGRACLRVWPELQIGTFIKHSVNKHVTHITRQMAHGVIEQARAVLTNSQGGRVLNTAFIERLNGMMRERLATLTRKCRNAAHRLKGLHTGMYLLGCTYNFCVRHDVACVEWSTNSAQCPGLSLIPLCIIGNDEVESEG